MKLESRYDLVITDDLMPEMVANGKKYIYIVIRMARNL